MQMQSQHIVRSSLHDILVNHLRELILNGELRPGDKIPEQRLCERFGVSRTPMREAVKVLAAEGVIRLQISRGAIVAQTTPEEIEDLFPIIAALESVAGKQACERATDEQILGLRRLHDEMLEQYASGQESAYLRNNRAVHEALFDMAGNATLSSTYQQMLTRIHCIRFVVGKSREHWKQAIDEHEAIVDALEKRDGKRLGELLNAHVNGTAVRTSQEYIRRANTADKTAA
ncbi:MAG: transcriptional regulator, GntR family [Herminiimonas sp.]|nr:transcriptional regulator, GntR family [Herminiimonas sp.]